MKAATMDPLLVPPLRGSALSWKMVGGGTDVPPRGEIFTEHHHAHTSSLQVLPTRLIPMKWPLKTAPEMLYVWV